MPTIQKPKGRELVILNVTDTHITKKDLDEKNDSFRTMCFTTEELVRRVKPDLITHTGDFTFENSIPVYEFYADFLDKFGIPYAFVWGNHDNETDMNGLHRAAAAFHGHKLCLFEEGDESLGSGNYVIEIEESGKAVEALIMMDTHDKTFSKDDWSFAHLTEKQLEWYEDRVRELKEKGCDESILFTHMPIYAYKTAYNAAVKNPEYRAGLWESYGSGIWNEGYKDSIGVKWEDICCPKADDGVLEKLTECGHTKYAFCGHEHVNNFSINYCGVRLTYALKTGPGAYWEPEMNGGTVIKIGSRGLCDMYHEYVVPERLK